MFLAGREHSDVAYVVVLLTGDDVASTLKAADAVAAAEPAETLRKLLRPRGRQNVVLELGFFIAHLGRSRVAVLLGPDVERPSDIEGVLYTNLEDHNQWKSYLRREMIVAGLPVRG